MSRKCYRKRHKRWAASASKRNRALPMDQQIHDALGQYMAECTAAPVKEAKQDKVDEGGGTYAGVRFDKDTLDNLTAYLEYLTQAMGLKEPVDPKDFHTTIVYSRKTVPAFKPKSYDDPTTVTAKKNRGYRLELFGPDKTTLVLTYRSPLLQERFDASRKLGATTDFPDYQPHVTLSYNATKAAARGAKWLKQFKLPDFPLRIIEEYVEPIDEGWQDKKAAKPEKKRKKKTEAHVAPLVSKGLYSLIAYFNGDFEGVEAHMDTSAAQTHVKPPKPVKPAVVASTGLFLKPGREIAKGLLKQTNGDARKAIQKLNHYRDNVTGKLVNVASLNLAHSLLNERLPMAEAAE